MQCSVVIPCHGGAELTAACVQSLLAQQGSHELEVLLVDNARDSATGALAALDPRVRVLAQPRNLGFAGGCNAGLRQARLPFVLFCNNDTQAAPNLLSRLGAALARDLRIAFAAPVSNMVKGPARLPVGDLGRTDAGRQSLEQQLAQECHGMLQDVDTLAGTCLLGRRDTFVHLGGFDERFGPGNHEDDDLCLRARLLGHRLVIARDAFLHHEAHHTFRALGLDVGAEIARTREVFAAKWRDDPAGRAWLRHLDGDLEAAAAAAPAAQRAHPAWPDADLLLGRFYAASRRPAQAMPHLQAFLRECPQHTGAVASSILCCLELQQPERAQSLWRAARASCYFSADEMVELLRRLGEHARAAGNWPEAEANFAAAVALRPQDASLHNSLGVALLAQRRFGEAIAALERAAAAGLALAHTNLGICHYQAGNPERALQHFAAAARELPADPTVQRNYATALRGLQAGTPAQGPGAPGAR